MKLFKRKEDVASVKESSGPEEMGETCDVAGCNEPAHRAVSAKNVAKAGLNVKKERGKAHLCKEHYKEYKKATKKDRELERLGR